MHVGRLTNALLRAERLRCRHAMGYVTLVAEDRHAKPNPDLFLAASVKLAVHPSQAVVIGDSVGDLLAAPGGQRGGRRAARRLRRERAGSRRRPEGMPGTERKRVV